MRILHVSQPTDGGCAVVVAQLVAGNVAAGHEVSVACPATNQLRHWAVEAGADWLPLEMSREPQPRDMRAGFRLRRLARGFDVVHLHSSKAGALGRIVLGTRGPRTVFSPHGWSWHVATGRRSALFKKIERALAHRSHAVVCVSHAEAEEGRHVLPSEVKIDVIENGVDTVRFCPSPDDRRSERTILSVGRLDYAKGHDRLIAAMPHVGAEFDLTIIGEGPMREDLERQVSSLGLSARVRLPGHQDPLDHLRACAVVVFPSRWEGLSLALLEAMSTGCPLVATSACAGDVLGESGLEVVGGSDRDVALEIAAAINRLSADDHIRAELGSRARKTAIDGYSLPRTLKNYLTLYEGLLDSATARPPHAN